MGKRRKCEREKVILYIPKQYILKLQDILQMFFLPYDQA